MKWMIPGTVIPIEEAEASSIQERLSAMFLAGGIVLSQAANATGLEPYAIQNWVKRGFLTPPQKKKYSLNQFCRIVTINMLRAALSMEDICRLLEHVNGDLDDESDDLIDDAKLYFLFIRLAVNHRQMNTPQGREEYLEAVLADYEEPVPGARERVAKVLRIMLTAWAAAQLRQVAMQQMEQLKGENQ